MKKLATYCILVLFVSLVVRFVKYTSEKASVTFTEDLQHWRQEGRYLLFGSYLIYYRDDHNHSSVTEDTLVILHGYPTSSYDFAKIWSQLTARYRRVVSFDYLGFGLSDKPLEYNYTVHSYADSYFHVVSQLGIHKNNSKVHILAHDLGDTVAQEIIARLIETKNEHAITSISLLNGGVFPTMHKPKLIQTLLLNPYLGPIISHFITLTTFSRSFSEVFGANKPSEKELSDHFNLIKFNNGLAISHKTIKYIKDRTENSERWTYALKRTSIPIIFINGPADPISGEHMALHFRQEVPHQRVVILSREVGHYPQLEAPEATLQAVYNFQDSLVQ